MSDLKYIDLFAGAGGLSEGFISQGFTPIAHVELDKAACYTLKTRIAYHYLRRKKKENLYNSYLKGEINRKKLYSLIPEEQIKSVINAEIGKDNSSIFERIDSILGKESVDLIIGGPPCQAYSVVGRAPLKNKLEDHRTNLYIHYGEFLKRYNPKAFVFENVPGILSAADGFYFDDLKMRFQSLGYKVEARKINSYDFDVVQRRERVIIIGWKETLKFEYPQLQISADKYFRDDIFSDLPSIKPGENQKIQYYTRETNKYLTKTGIRNGVDFVSQHITRPQNEKDLSIYRLAIEKLAEGIRLKNNDIPIEKRTIKNTKDFLDRFKVVNHEPHTMIAHIAKDGHHFIHPDVDQLRSISVREAARIQSFPDNYYFEGFRENVTRSAGFRQIGNAVPPILAEKIAEQIKNLLNG